MPRLPRIAKLSTTFHLACLAILIILSMLAVGFHLHKSIYEESITAVFFIFTFLFLYFFLILYFGLRYDTGISERELYTNAHNNFSKSFNIETAEFPNIEIPHLGGDDIVSAFFAALYFILFSILFLAALFLLAWIGLNVMLFAFISAFIPIYYIFRISLRIILIKGIRCKGKLLKSILVASKYALLYSFALGGCMFLCEFMCRKLAS